MCLEMCSEITIKVQCVSGPCGRGLTPSEDIHRSAISKSLTAEVNNTNHLITTPPPLNPVIYLNSILTHPNTELLTKFNPHGKGMPM